MNRAGVRLWLLLILLTGLACGGLSPATPTPAYLGLFDCYGTEGGLGAYAGRLNFQPGGGLTFKDYDNAEHTGAWTYAAAAHTFTFTGSTGLASAVYTPATDT